MVQIGNKEVELNLIAELGKWFDVEFPEEDEAFLKLRGPGCTSEEVLKIVETIVNLYPDECGIQDDGRLRLWWD